MKRMHTEDVARAMDEAGMLAGATHKERVRAIRAVCRAIPVSILEGRDMAAFGDAVYMAGTAVREYMDFQRNDLEDWG